MTTTNTTTTAEGKISKVRQWQLEQAKIDAEIEARITANIDAEIAYRAKQDADRAKARTDNPNPQGHTAMTNVTLMTNDGQTISTRKIGNGKTYKWALVRFGRRIATSKDRTVHIAHLGNNESAIMREANRYVTYWKQSVEVVPVIDGIATISAEAAARLAAD